MLCMWSRRTFYAQFCLSLCSLQVTRSGETFPDVRTLFNNCDYSLNRARFPLTEGTSTVPPLVLIVDPRTVSPAMRTIDSLKYVEGVLDKSVFAHVYVLCVCVCVCMHARSCKLCTATVCARRSRTRTLTHPPTRTGIESTSLEIFFDGCGPADPAWPPAIIHQCLQGIAPQFVQRLLKLDFMRVGVHAIVPSDSMLVVLPVKSTRWDHRLWRMAEASSPEYLKVRSMHVMREVLATHDAAPSLVGPVIVYITRPP